MEYAICSSRMAFCPQLHSGSCKFQHLMFVTGRRRFLFIICSSARGLRVDDTTFRQRCPILSFWHNCVLDGLSFVASAMLIVFSPNYSSFGKLRTFTNAALTWSR